MCVYERETDRESAWVNTLIVPCVCCVSTCVPAGGKGANQADGTHPPTRTRENTHLPIQGAVAMRDDVEAQIPLLVVVR